MSDFLADHSCHSVQTNNEDNCITFTPWQLYFDGSKTKKGSGIGVVIISPKGTVTELNFRLDGEFTNNQVEYEALVQVFLILNRLGVKSLEILGDSQLVINQTSGDYKCISPTLIPYRNKVEQLLKTFDDVIVKCIPRNFNHRANLMSQVALGYKMSYMSTKGRNNMTSL